jgi:tetratricopeptide (TPR) repeat protein
MNEYPDWFNAYDSYAEALMNQNKNEAAIEYYKKSLEMNPGNDNAVEKLKELGVEYNKEFKVPVEILQSYTGTYELMPNFKITIRLEDEQLLAKATGQPEFPIFPMSETKFYYKVVEAQIEFIKNEAGEVESLILYQGGKELPGKKIE